MGREQPPAGEGAFTGEDSKFGGEWSSENWYWKTLCLASEPGDPLPAISSDDPVPTSEAPSRPRPPTLPLPTTRPPIPRLGDSPRPISLPPWTLSYFAFEVQHPGSSLVAGVIG